MCTRPSANSAIEKLNCEHRRSVGGRATARLLRKRWRFNVIASLDEGVEKNEQYNAAQLLSTLTLPHGRYRLWATSMGSVRGGPPTHDRTRRDARASYVTSRGVT